MEKHLQNAASADRELREAANSYLRECEKTQGFTAGLVALFPTSDVNAKTLCLILIKNTIFRHWTNVNRISNLDKETIKQFLMGALITEGIIYQWRSFIIESISIINKYEYLDTWSNLATYLGNFKLDEVYLKLLSNIIKVQLKKASIRSKNTLKELFNHISSPLQSTWDTVQNPYIEKIYVKFAILLESDLLTQNVVNRLNLYLSLQNAENYTKILVKGVYLMLVKASLPIKLLAPGLLQTFTLASLNLRPNLVSDNVIFKEILDFFYLCIKEILQKFPELSIQISALAEPLLQRTLEIELDERWEIWKSGEISHFLESTADSDDDSIRKLQEVLLKAFPNLLQTVTSLISTSLSFLQIHTICNLYCILPKFSVASENDFKEIIKWLSCIKVEGIEKLVILRDSVILTKKWLKVLHDYSFVYELLLTIKNSTTDEVILYECILTLKQIIYAPLPQEILVRIANDFAMVAFQLISQVNAPHGAWHLVTFICNLIDSSESNEHFVQGLGSIGLKKLLTDSNEMTILSVSEMLEKLLIKYSGNSTLNSAISLHINSRLSIKDKQVYALWHTFLINFKGEVSSIDSLLPFLSGISEKHREIKTKIAEEYLLIYYEQGLDHKITEFLANFYSLLVSFSNNPQKDYSCLEFMFCTKRISIAEDFNGLNEVIKYLRIGLDDVYENLCNNYSVLILAALVLKDHTTYDKFDIRLWFEKAKNIENHNYLVLIAKALPILVKHLPQETIQIKQEWISKVKNCTSLFGVEENVNHKSFTGINGVSYRYTKYLFT